MGTSEQNAVFLPPKSEGGERETAVLPPHGWRSWGIPGRVRFLRSSPSSLLHDVHCPRHLNWTLDASH